MKSRLLNNISIVLSIFSSIITIYTFICMQLGLKVPEINLEYICLNYGIYILLMSFGIIFLSLINARYKTKVYNAKIVKKYKEIIDLFKFTLLTKEEFDYEYLSNLIKDIYPYKNKSKINLVFKRKIDDTVLYDTSNYDKWQKKGMDKVFKLKSNRIDWRATNEYFEKREIYMLIGDIENNIVSLNIYSDSKAVFTKRKKKMIKPFLDSIQIFMYVILAQQNGGELN